MCCRARVPDFAEMPFLANFRIGDDNLSAWRLSCAWSESISALLDGEAD